MIDPYYEPEPISNFKIGLAAALLLLAFFGFTWQVWKDIKDQQVQKEAGYCYKKCRELHMWESGAILEGNGMIKCMCKETR